MNTSLQWRLSLTLAVTIVVAGFLAAIASFGLGYWEAQELQDDTLQQIAMLFTQGANADSKGAGGMRDYLAASRNEDSRVIVVRLPLDSRPEWLPENLAQGFHTLRADEERTRVYVLRIAHDEHIVVGQATEARDEIALNSAWRTLVPVLLLLPLLAWLTLRIVATELAPVRKLASTVNNLPADRPVPLPTSDVPAEIASFVQAINGLLHRVTRLLEEKRRFIADAAHELRTPLTALSVQAQNIEQADSLDVMKQRMAALRTGIGRAQRLTEQLLTLARTQAATPEQTEVDVSKLVREVIADYLPLAEASGIDLGMDETATHTVVGSSDTLRLILSNAIDNAVRYTPSGGEVTIRLRAEGSDLVVDVVDTGPGIKPADRIRVFEAFHRVDGSSGSGSGLGLAIASDAASRLGGSVSLHERPEGTGVVFRYRQRRIT